MALEKKVGKVEIATVWQDALAFWEPLYVVSAVLTKYGKKKKWKRGVKKTPYSTYLYISLLCVVALGPACFLFSEIVGSAHHQSATRHYANIL